MELLIVRHASAVPHGTPGIPDDERPLTPRGEERFREAAAGLAELLRCPEAILTSPLPRARRTAEIAAEAWQAPVVENAPALATGNFEDLARTLSRFSGDAFVAVFGHEPHVSSLLGRLIGGRGEALLFKKGGAALVELNGTLAEGGSLVWFLPPRILRDLA